ncbi:hypothetical protein NDU88_006043 [Pleurodeles waltl]|uniref:Uncharacterized protein n=1 Tax=Pleurodeles waltl TaxID=8319 RepID=A0AAV7WWG1_PLEWA|nr:hypothetical protein NDU88_006043 [Pleurodeles waltl]
MSLQEASGHAVSPANRVCWRCREGAGYLRALPAARSSAAKVCRVGEPPRCQCGVRRNDDTGPIYKRSSRPCEVTEAFPGLPLATGSSGVGHSSNARRRAPTARAAREEDLGPPLRAAPAAMLQALP